MAKQITKSEADELVRIPGKVVGEVFNTTGKYILGTEGKSALERVKKESERLGHPIPFGTARSFDWYPIGLRALSFIVVKNTLNWEDEDLIKMGYAAPSYSFIAKLFIKYLVSIEKIFKSIPRYWDKHFTIGRLEPYKLDEKEKYLILRIHNFKVHPLFCVFHLGYFKRVAKFEGKKNIEVKETKCMFDGYPYHEFLITWD